MYQLFKPLPDESWSGALHIPDLLVGQPVANSDGTWQIVLPLRRISSSQGLCRTLEQRLPPVESFPKLGIDNAEEAQAEVSHMT